jgi:hypothetical protein
MWRNTDKGLRPRWRFLALIGLPRLLALAQTAPPAQPFQRLDGCAYKPRRWDDGDSFHVIQPDQKEKKGLAAAKDSIKKAFRRVNFVVIQSLPWSAASFDIYFSRNFAARGFPSSGPRSSSLNTLDEPTIY